MQDQKASSAGDTVAGVYAIAFLGASLVAVAGIAVTSVFRALDAWDERKEYKRKAQRGPRPMVTPTPARKPEKPTAANRPVAVPKPTAPSASVHKEEPAPKAGS